MMLKKLRFFWICLAVVVLAACNLPVSPAPVAPPPSGVISGIAPTPVLSTAASAVPTEAPSATQTVAPTADNTVTITIVSDSLNIRRGPSIYYDALGFLKAGQSATALARDANGSWLYIPLPDNPSAFGWISALTQYSAVQGNVNSLGVQTPDPAKPAYIRNCTYHPMMIKPGDVLLQPLTDKKNRIAQFPPGKYSAYDQNVSNTLVLTVEIKEGDSVDILTDGLKNTYGCP